MTNIAISNLQSTGLDLFSDDENYLCEVSENFSGIVGGADVQVITSRFPFPTTYSPLCIPPHTLRKY